jgi:hypothetical protein
MHAAHVPWMPSVGGSDHVGGRSAYTIRVFDSLDEMLCLHAIVVLHGSRRHPVMDGGERSQPERQP